MTVTKIVTSMLPRPPVSLYGPAHTAVQAYLTLLPSGYWLHLSPGLHLERLGPMGCCQLKPWPECSNHMLVWPNCYQKDVVSLLMMLCPGGIKVLILYQM